MVLFEHHCSSIIGPANAAPLNAHLWAATKACCCNIRTTQAMSMGQTNINHSALRTVLLHPATTAQNNSCSQQLLCSCSPQYTAPFPSDLAVIVHDGQCYARLLTHGRCSWQKAHLMTAKARLPPASFSTRSNGEMPYIM